MNADSRVRVFFGEHLRQSVPVSACDFRAERTRFCVPLSTIQWLSVPNSADDVSDNCHANRADNCFRQCVNVVSAQAVRTRFCAMYGGLSGGRQGQFAGCVGNAGGQIGFTCAYGDARQGGQAKRMGDVCCGLTCGKPLA